MSNFKEEGIKSKTKRHKRLSQFNIEQNGKIQGNSLLGGCLNPQAPLNPTMLTTVNLELVHLAHPNLKLDNPILVMW